MNEYKICDICKGFKADGIIQKLKKMDPEANIIIGCQGMCAIGNRNPFVLLNGIPIIGMNEEDLIEKIQKKIL